MALRIGQQHGLAGVLSRARLLVGGGWIGSFRESSTQAAGRGRKPMPQSTGGQAVDRESDLLFGSVFENRREMAMRLITVEKGCCL